MREVYGTIRKLGATSKYKGYYFVAEAIRMTMEFQERPMKITKDIIPVVPLPPKCWDLQGVTTRESLALR